MSNMFNHNSRDIDIHDADDHPFKNSRFYKFIMRFLMYIPLIFWALIVIFPFYYMIVVATKSGSEIYGWPPPISIGSNWFSNLVSNYQLLLSIVPFWKNLWNSIYIAAIQTLLAIFFCSLGAFGFSMYEFKGKKILFSIMLFTVMIPGVIGLVPYFSMMVAIGWLNTARAIYLPGIAGAVGIFMIKQYIEQAIPKELIEAARIDGCSESGIYFKIVLPLITPILGAFGIITFLGSWNNFAGPLIVLKTKDAMTVPVALTLLKGLQKVDYGAIMIGTTIVIIPFVIVFLMFSRLIIDKVTEGSIK